MFTLYWVDFPTFAFSPIITISLMNKQLFQKSTEALIVISLRNLTRLETWPQNENRHKWLIKENQQTNTLRFNWAALQTWVHVNRAAVFYSSPQGPRFRWQGTCCRTPRSVQWQSLGPQKRSFSVLNKSVWSCWRYVVDVVEYVVWQSINI